MEVKAFLERETLDRTLGVRYLKAEKDEVVAELMVTPKVHQPFGFLHGGATVALAESVASVGGFLNCPPGHAAFGLEINCNHLRKKREGTIRAVGRPLHVGRTTQVWEVKVYDEEGRLVAASRCTLANTSPPSASRSPPVLEARMHRAPGSREKTSCGAEKSSRVTCG